MSQLGNDYFVSNFGGNLYLLRNNGEVIKLLDIQIDGLNCADFEYIDELSLFLIPATNNNKVLEYKYINGN